MVDDDDDVDVGCSLRSGMMVDVIYLVQWGLLKLNKR